MPWEKEVLKLDQTQQNRTQRPLGCYKNGQKKAKKRGKKKKGGTKRGKGSPTF